MKANVAFLVGGENGDMGGKPLRTEVENQKTQRMRGVEYAIEPRLHWWKASYCITEPSLVLGL